MVHAHCCVWGCMDVCSPLHAARGLSTARDWLTSSVSVGQDPQNWTFPLTVLLGLYHSSHECKQHGKKNGVSRYAYMLHVCVCVGGTNSKWQKRWFRLTGTQLEYFAQQGDAGKKTPKGVVDLTIAYGARTRDECHKDIKWPKSASAEASFAVATEKRTWYMYADSEEAAKWESRQLVCARTMRTINICACMSHCRLA